jgi:hypothetical protein
VKFLISTLSRQLGCSGSLFPPELRQLPSAGLLLSRSEPVTIWSICPIFSARVMRRSRSSTREATGARGSRYGRAVGVRCGCRRAAGRGGDDQRGEAERHAGHPQWGG